MKAVRAIKKDSLPSIISNLRWTLMPIISFTIQQASGTCAGNPRVFLASILSEL